MSANGKPARRRNTTLQQPLGLRASDILSKIDTKDGLKDYVEAASAILWFYEEHPVGSGAVVTEMLSIDPPIFKASVLIDGQLVATGHANPEARCNTLRKVESAAVRRALSNAGYNAKKALIRLARRLVEEGAADKLGSGKNAGVPRRIGATQEGAR